MLSVAPPLANTNFRLVDPESSSIAAVVAIGSNFFNILVVCVYVCLYVFKRQIRTRGPISHTIRETKN